MQTLLDMTPAVISSQSVDYFRFLTNILTQCTFKFVNSDFFFSTKWHRLRCDHLIQQASHLEVHRPVLVRHMQHQVTQHLLPPELLHRLEGSGSVSLHRVVQTAGPVHGRDHDSREIRVACGTFLPQWTMHSGRERSRFFSEFSLTVFYKFKFLALIPFGSDFQRRKFIWSCSS